MKGGDDNPTHHAQIIPNPAFGALHLYVKNNHIERIGAVT